MGEPSFLIYEPAPGETRLLVRLEDESVWLSQAQMAELFQSSKQNISLHIRNVFEEGELEESA
ncbi:MAG: cytochrome C biogenesis protein CycH, partial [Armatimonadota bacterium]|nr:cytochrome C biogenesis protein CycH [Armatimonadota bacterium]